MKQEEAKRKWNEVDVLKAGYHGSNTSSTQEFLNQVKPKYVFVSAGKNNKYRFQTLKLWKELKRLGLKFLERMLMNHLFGLHQMVMILI